MPGRGAREWLLNGEIQTNRVRPTADGVRARLAEAGIAVPEACLAGTVANLIVLQDHVAVLRTFPLDDHSRSALEFRV
jgi:hypothetical protein